MDRDELRTLGPRALVDSAVSNLERRGLIALHFHVGTAPMWHLTDPATPPSP